MRNPIDDKKKSTFRLHHGGNFVYKAWVARVVDQRGDHPVFGSKNVGFRICRSKS